MGLFSNKKSNESKEYAQIVDWALPWDTGAPLPQVFGNGHKTILIYFIGMANPDWDGTNTTSIDNSSDTKYPLALVEFKGGTFRFGIADEETFGGLSIADKGMGWYEAHEIKNSNWINELKKIHKVHPYFHEASWEDKKHYMFLFHDEMLEVISKDYIIEQHNSTFKDLAKLAVDRLNE